MAGYSVSSTAHLSDEELKTLGRRLEIALANLTPGEQRLVRGPGGDSAQITPQRAELEHVVAEIKQTAKEGINIAAHAESHPLIPVFEAAKVDLPPDIKADHDYLKYDYYIVEVTFSIDLPAKQFPTWAELNLTVSDDVADPKRHARPIRLFPGAKDVQYFTVNAEGSFGVDASANFSTPQFNLQSVYGDLGAKVGVQAGVKAGIVIGPFTFSFRKAAIEVKGESDPQILWRYIMQSELAGRNDFKSILLLKVAQETRMVQMNTSLSVIPAMHNWLVFQKQLPPLHAPSVILPVELLTSR